MGQEIMKLAKTFLLGAAGMLFLSNQINATELKISNTFSTGISVAARDDTERRLAVLEALVMTLQTDLSRANKVIAILQTDLDIVEANSALELDGLVSVGDDESGYLTVLFTGTNLQVINGVSQTTPNGLGNIIVGYNQLNQAINIEVCSYGLYSNRSECESNGQIWSYSHKTGSHNMIGGAYNNYSQTGGLVFGRRNFITSYEATVSGGIRNVSSGFYSSVSGGFNNTASDFSSNVSGGQFNTASDFSSSVSGGRNNTASGYASSVSGGVNNVASGQSSSVSGGENNIVAGEAGSISGGFSHFVNGFYDWQAGTLFEDQ